MKKKIVSTIMILILLVTLVCAFMTSCNKLLLDTTYTFKYVHVIEAGKCYKVIGWTDYEDGDQLQVNIEGIGTCLFHSNQIVLLADKCPFGCNHY